MKLEISLWIATLFLCAGCDPRVHTESRTTSEGVSYSNLERQERLKRALSDAGIPYEVVVEQRNEEFIRWDASYSEAVKQITDSIFLPSGRNLSLDDARQNRFKAWLEQNAIPYRVVREEGRESIVWEEKDAARVRAWEEFPIHYDSPPAAPGHGN